MRNSFLLCSASLFAALLPAAFLHAQFQPPTWEIQQPQFVHKAHFVFTPTEALMPGHATSSFSGQWNVQDSHGRVAQGISYRQHLPPGASVKQEITDFTLDLADVPALPREDWMPPLRSLRYSVDFYYDYSRSGELFWKTEGKLWSTDVDKFAAPSSAIKAAVNLRDFYQKVAAAEQAELVLKIASVTATTAAPAAGEIN